MWRRLLAELVGTGALVTVVVGSGIAAGRLSPGDVGLQLLENSTATALGLAVLILVFGPASGAHFNPVVSAADWLLGRRAGSGLTGREAAAYAVAQVVGGVLGAVTANAMFDLAPVQVSSTHRVTPGHLLGEVVATAGLVAVVFVLARTGRAALSAAAVGGYIGAAYWFTSSTSFANPAVTAGRVFSDTFAGIAPTSVPGFVLAQVAGAALGLLLVVTLYPGRAGTAAAAAGAVVPHDRSPDREASAVPDPSDQPRAADQPQTAGRPSVLFVCVHNAGRSQMAAGFLSALSGGAVEVRSAGSVPATELNPVAVAAMAEVGIDIAAARPKVLTAEAVQTSDVVITMGCGDACPFFPGVRYLDWELDDPAGQGIDAVRPIRDEIRSRVERLLAELLPAVPHL